MRAQDKVYYNGNHPDDWKVTEIAQGYIKGIDVNNPQVSYSTNRPNILFVFNSIGNFLVIPGLYQNEMKSAMYIRNFLQHINNTFRRSDQIITVDNTIINGNIEGESNELVVYDLDSKKHTIARSDIAIIIYKDGHHKLVANVNKAFRILRAIQDKYNQLAFSPNQADNADTASHEPDTQSSNIVQTSAKPRAETVKELDPVILSSLQEKAILNIKELESYIKIICDKQSQPDKTSKVIEQALYLFASEESRIEVSSRNRSEAQQYKVRVYLNRLGIMKYNRVIIEWYNIQYVSKVRKNPDETYTGFIEFEQLFTGISSDRKHYQDVTRKTVEIILKPYNKRSGGEENVEWNVFLGNIGISVSKRE